MMRQEVIEQIGTLPVPEQGRVAEAAIRRLGVQARKALERLLRRPTDPEIPDNFWEGSKDIEDGRTVDLETALRDAPPGAT